MNQRFETQLQVVQRALSDVVLPALGHAEAHVAEQLSLSLAALAFLQQRLPQARGYYRGSVSTSIHMAQAIILLLEEHAVADLRGLDALATEGRTLLASPEADIGEYRTFTGDMRQTIADVSAAAQGSLYEDRLDRLILELSAPILLQERVWCAPLGFELRPQELPELCCGV